MKPQDTLQRFIFENAPVRGEIVRLGTSFDSIVTQHEYPSFIRALLGEMLTAVVLLSATIKFKGRLTLQFQGKGKLKLVIAQSDHEFHIRGLAQMSDDLTEDELADNLKNGLLAILMQPESGGEGYQSVVPWQGDSVAQSLEGYFRDSEQLATRIWISISRNHAAGLLLQMMPESAKKENLTGVQQDWEQIILFTETLTPNELLTLDTETLLRRLYSHENEVRLFSPENVMFRCTCSNKRSENAILMLGREEVDEELKTKKQIVVTCDFCNKEYVYDAVDIERIFKQSDGGSMPSGQVH